MTDIYSTQILNSTRNSNTIIQGSTLQSSKGSLNTMFNLQGLRTIKGRITFGNSPDPNWLVVVNFYDSSPVKLNSGDIVISLALANGTKSNDANYNEGLFNDQPLQQWALPIRYNIQFYLGTTPTYISIDGTKSNRWIPNPQVINSANTLTGVIDTQHLSSYISDVPSPKTFNILINNCIGSINNSGNSCYGGLYQWLNCYILGWNGNMVDFRNIIQYDPSINVTLLVLNQNVSQ
jgi:hypothetical protein